MSINASSYIVSYRTPSAPKISVEVRSASMSSFESAVTVYNSAASAYVEEYRAVIEQKDYVTDRLKKDLCGLYTGMTESGINLENNTVTLHVKADDVFEHAVSGMSLNYYGNVNDVVSTFDKFYSSFYQNDEHSDFILQSAYNATETYDLHAFTIDSAVGGVSSGSIFIVDAPNVDATSRTYTNYVSGSAKYSLSRDKDTGGWVINNIEGAVATVVATSEEDGEPTSGMTWTVA